MRKTEADPCVYVNNDEENDIIIIVYVDDLLIGSRDINRLNERKKILKQMFKINDLGPLCILDINIERKGSTEENEIFTRKIFE